VFDVARVAPGAAGSIRVLFVGHAAIPTGFARVIHSLLRELPEAFEIHHLGINLDQEFAKEHVPVPNPGWTIHHNEEGLHSAARLSAVIAQVRPSLVVVVDEPWVCVRLSRALIGHPEFSSVFYGAVDGEESVGPRVAAELARLDCFVSFTRFGNEIVRRAIEKLGLPAPRLEIIPHGVDCGLFFPVAGGPEDGFRASRKLSRKLLFPGEKDLEQAFIVLNANRNQPFKRIEVFLKGFALFAADKPPHVKAYLHMATRAALAGEIPLVDALGIRGRILSPAYTQHPEFANSRLNLLYCACDAGVNTSIKEGWGLVSFEHAATGGAQIVPRHTACAELWSGGAGLFFDSGYESVAKALEILYHDPARRQAVAEAGYYHARRPEYSWRNIASQWERLFHGLIDVRESGVTEVNSA
jgi:D-inositol-3-phosphate glycosyltransferase